MRNYDGTCKGICSYNLIYILIQFLPLKSLVFVVHFLNAFWHGNEAFPKGSFQNEIVPLLVVFLLLYSKHKGVIMCFYQCRYFVFTSVVIKIRIFHSCRIRVALVSLLSHAGHTRVASVALVLHSCPLCLALVL